LSISMVWSLAMAAGERFFCSRMGVKDWAKAIEQVSARASGICLKCMGARVANSRGFREMWLGTESLTQIFTDGTDQGYRSGRTGMPMTILADLVAATLVVSRA
jgi:hypothetical protein